MLQASEFEASHYALTLHLPADSCKQPEAREALRAELFEVCSEGAFGVAVLTAADPLSSDAKLNHGLSADDTRRVVHEFVMAGFRRVGIVRGGFVSLTKEQKSSLVSDHILPQRDGDGGGGSGGGKKRMSAGKMIGSVKKMGGAMGEQMKKAVGSKKKFGPANAPGGS